MKLKFYELEGNEPEILLRALLSGMRPDVVRRILRDYIDMLVKQYQQAGAGIHVYAIEKFGGTFDVSFISTESVPTTIIRIMVINHGNLDRQDLDRLDTLEDLYNTIDEWGVE